MENAQSGQDHVDDLGHKCRSNKNKDDVDVSGNENDEIQSFSRKIHNKTSNKKKKSHDEGMEESEVDRENKSSHKKKKQSQNDDMEESE